MSEKLIREDSLKSYANTYIFEGINESDNIFLFLGCDKMILNIISHAYLQSVYPLC